MKKITALVLTTVFVLTACGGGGQQGITLTKEMYDELIGYKIENDRLRSEINYLEQRVADLSGEPITSESGTKPAAQTTTTAAETTTKAPETTAAEADEGYSGEEIAAMTLTLFQDSYGYYGYKNDGGEVIIPAQFDSATTFADGVAKVTNGGKVGTINRQGVITWSSTDSYKKATVKPRNDVAEGSDFAKFLTTYRQALEERDEAYVKAHTHPNVKISFGGASGWDGLVNYWSLDEGSDAFYKMMKTTLKFGAVDSSGGLGNSYTAPYVFTDFPAAYDAYTHTVVTGANVNVRTRPSVEASEVITKVSHEVLKVLDSDKDGWTKVQLPDGTRAYISSNYVWSPIGYRARFTKVDGTWLLEFFVKGD